MRCHSVEMRQHSHPAQCAIWTMVRRMYAFNAVQCGNKYRALELLSHSHAWLYLFCSVTFFSFDILTHCNERHTALQIDPMILDYNSVDDGSLRRSPYARTLNGFSYENIEIVYSQCPLWHRAMRPPLPHRGTTSTKFLEKSSRFITLFLPMWL